MHPILRLSLVAVLLAACSPKPDSPRFVVANVGGEKITRADLEAKTALVFKRIGADSSKLQPEQVQMLEWHVLNQLVDTKLVEEAVAKAGLTDTVNKEVDKEIDQIKSQFPDEKMFNEQLEKSGMTLADLKEQASFEIGLQQLLVKKGDSSLEVTKEDAEKFYKDHPELWKIGEQINAKHILIRANPNASIEELKEKKAAIDAARARIAGGESFEKVASEVSEDPGSKTRGGQLPPFEKGQMVPEFEEMAYKMEPGKLSPVFKTAFGYHILQVVNKTKARVVAFEEVADRISQSLVNQKRSAAIRGMLENLKKEVKVDLHIDQPSMPMGGGMPAPAPEAQGQ